MSQELDDLRNLVKHPGFLRWKQDQVAQLHADMLKWMASAANDTDDLNALNKIRQVSAAIKAVERTFAWPDERIRQLEQLTAHDTSLAGYSRRGGL